MSHQSLEVGSSTNTFSFRGFKSTQIRTEFDCFFGTTTIPAHPSVGPFTFEITPDFFGEFLFDLASQR